MSSDLAIRAVNLAKSYHLFATPRDRLRQFFWGGRRQYYQDFAALSDVSFEIHRGETVGIIGRNGSGKSTLLQLVCGTLSPTAGTVETSGRVAAMLELGSGFNPEFTGLENIYLNGHILGLKASEIDARLDRICAFADIGEFVAHPVKTYSSGMHVRLAFAVMVHVDADILIIDEALAVGDALFTQKCMRFLREFKERGTLLFVSHDTTAVTSLCDRAIWLDHGRIRMSGSSKQTCEAYLQHVIELQQGESPEKRAEPPRPVEAVTRPPTRDTRLDVLRASDHRTDIRIFEFDPAAASFGKRGARIIDVSLQDGSGNRLAWAVGGDTVVVVVRIEAGVPLRAPIVGFLVKNRLGQNLFGDNTYLSTRDCPLSLAAGERAEARFEFDLPLLPPGDYSINAAVADGSQESHVQHDWIHDALLFRVETSSVRHALVGIPMRSVELCRCDTP